jgi:hypothetical protein
MAILRHKNHCLNRLTGPYSICNEIPVNNHDKLKLFDCMVNPILSYSSSIWGFHKAPDIGRLHLKFLT